MSTLTPDPSAPQPSAPEPSASAQLSSTSLSPAQLRRPAIDAALAAAARLLGTEVVFIGGVTEETYTFHRIYGEWPEITEGLRLPRVDTFCHRMLDGAPAVTVDAAGDRWYAQAPARMRYGICSYVGVPIYADSGQVIGTLCGLDRGPVQLSTAAVEILEELARIVAAELSPPGDREVVIRRTPTGWAVAGSEEDSLVSAMTLADLLVEGLEPGPRPPKPPAELDEVARLRLAVTQLEHALGARVVVEQAIGVLAERQRSAPRQAFERLRRVARGRGRRVHDLAREVVASARDRSTPLPPELAGRR